MKSTGIQGIIRGDPHRTTVPDKKAPCPLDKVHSQFRVSAPNMHWVLDFTWVATWTGFAYMAFVIDASARKIVGWRVSTSAHAGGVLDALEQAVHDRRPGKGMGLVHHSDRGSICRSNTPNALPRSGPSHLSAVLATATSSSWSAPADRMIRGIIRRRRTRWPRRSTGSSRPRSSTDVVLGATSRPRWALNQWPRHSPRSASGES